MKTALPFAKKMFRSRYAREPLIVILAYVPYFLARGHVVQNAQDAFANAAHLVRLEQSLGVFTELSIQSAAISYGLLTHLFNIVYFYGHWPVIIACGVYLFFKNPRVYVITRNAFLISGGVALVLYTLYPVAPPRLSFPGFADTLAMTIPVSYDQSRLVNPYAALPSLHVGWNILIALGIFFGAKVWYVRSLAFVLPPAMFLAVVITGNHFYVDGVAGAMLAVLAFATAYWINQHGAEVRSRLGRTLGLAPSRASTTPPLS